MALLFYFASPYIVDALYCPDARLLPKTFDSDHSKMVTFRIEIINSKLVLLQYITTNARSEIRIGYHIITCHLELNISQQFGIY